MAIYVVMEQDGTKDADGGRRTAFVRDGFSFLALLLPAVWLVWHRLWIEALVALAAILCLGAFGSALGFGAAASTALSLLISLYIALEGSALRIAALRRRGWREWGVVKADNREDAESLYLLEAAAGPLTHGALPSVMASTQPWARAVTGPAMGLLDYPGSR